MLLFGLCERIFRLVFYNFPIEITIFATKEREKDMKKRFFSLVLATIFANALPAQTPPASEEGEEEWQYQLVFSDEFDQPTGSAPDPTKWQSSVRYGSTWNRWIVDSIAVAYIQEGKLACRAIPNTEPTRDHVPMITGAIETRDRFSFTYGKVEIRLRTNLHKGNFPAAWMMPQPPAERWPEAGEIDIFESIDAEGVAYHTVHSNWTYNLGHRSDPKSSFSEKLTVGQWHIYSLEWTATSLTWFVDGNVVGSYEKSNNPEALNQGQWPFDRPFYVILNQSVGDGSWAKAADTAYVYTTFFDYVRIYQRVPTGISDLHEETSENKTIQRANSSQLFDISGRAVGQPTKPGIYITREKKICIGR